MVLGVLLLAGAATSAAAQRITTRFPRPEVQAAIASRARIAADTVVRDRSGAKVLGALVGGAAGLFGGALIGARIDQASCNYCDDDGLAGAVYGGIIGESLLLGAGIQLADPDPRKKWRRLLLPPLVTLGAVAVATQSNTSIPLLVAVPIQIAVAW